MAPITITTIAITLFFTLNPVGNLPLFIAMLKDFPAERQRLIIVRENLIALVLMIAFGLFGPSLLEGINISRFSIKIGGGVILFLIALNMVFPKHPSVIDKAPQKREPLIVPLATPLIAGGGTLTAVMMYGLTISSYWTLIFATLIAWFVNSVILFCAPLAKRYLKEQLLDALEKLMGLILTLIACQMIVGGVIAYATGKEVQHAPISASSTEEPAAEPSTLHPPRTSLASIYRCKIWQKSLRESLL